MPPKIFNVDIRSIDRNKEKFPSASDFSIELGQTYYNVTSIKLGSMEVPKTRYTLEDYDNSAYFSEGIVIGDATMDQAYNRMEVTRNGNTKEYVIPATLMPVSDFAENQITTPQKHGLESFMMWSAQRQDRPKAVLVGAEPGSAATAAYRVGFFLHQIPQINFTDTTITFEEGYIKSMAIGSSSPGYIYVPPLHLQEIISLLNFIQNDSWRLQDGLIHVGQEDDSVQVSSIRNPSGKQISLGPILGFIAPTYGGGKAFEACPALPRLQVPAGFYASPPSLIANSTEEALMSRCLFTSESSFTISQMDAFFSESITIPAGHYTPELMEQVLRARATDTNFILEHVNDDGEASVRHVRWRVESAENFPFTLDFSNAKSVAISRLLGFRQRRYTGMTFYTGTAYAVSATTNVLPAPAPSPLHSSQDGDLRNAVEDAYRYPSGVLTVTGTTPSQQKFSFFTEPSESWAVPNKGTQKTYYESLRNVGVISITTKNMPRAQSYGFKRGDVMRVTGISQQNMQLQTIVNTGLKADQIDGQDVLNGVVSVVATSMGGNGYTKAPTVTVITEPIEGEKPTITAIVRQGKVAAYTIDSNKGTRFDRIPKISVAEPEQFTVLSAGFAFASQPERKVLTLTLNKVPSVDLTDRGALLTGSTGLDRVYSVVSQDGAEVVVSVENTDEQPLNANNAVGATLRFSVSSVVPVSTVHQSGAIDLAGSMEEATIGQTVVLSGAMYNASPTSITGFNGGTFTHAGTTNVSQGDRLLLRGSNADGVWVVETVESAGEFTLTGGGPDSITANAAFVILSTVQEKTPINVSINVAKPLSRPTASFQAAALPLPTETGFGGVCVFSPTPKQAHAVCVMMDDSIKSVTSSLPGFLNASASVNALSSTGAPQVRISGGTTVSDVFNTRTKAELSSATLSGELVPANDAHISISGETYSIIFGEFLSSTELKLTLSHHVSESASGSLELNNFYFDGTYEQWATNEASVTITHNLGWAALSLDGQSVDSTTAGTLYPSTMMIEWPGQYSAASDLVSSIDVVNNITTRVGIVTYAGYESKMFRYTIEYNAKSVNDGRGFYDSISGDNNIILTFSRLFAPRTEWFGASSSAIHRMTKEGRMLNRFQNQILLQRLGMTEDVYGSSSYVGDSQWWLDSMPYRLIQILDDTTTTDVGDSQHVHVMDDRSTPVLGKQIFPSSTNIVRWQGYEMQFDRPRNLQRIRVRLLDFDETIYPLHGRELSFSILLTSNLEMK